MSLESGVLVPNGNVKCRNRFSQSLTASLNQAAVDDLELNTSLEDWYISECDINFSMDEEKKNTFACKVTWSIEV